MWVESKFITDYAETKTMNPNKPILVRMTMDFRDEHLIQIETLSIKIRIYTGLADELIFNSNTQKDRRAWET